MNNDIRPFKVDIETSTIADLKSRLDNTRWPNPEVVDDWSQGVPLSYARELCTYWRDQYDMHRLEHRLNQFDQFITNINGVDIHFLHVCSPHAEARPLIMTHGWPGSVVEFLKVIPALIDPVAFGGDAADAFHVVCPSLPGYGFSGKPTTVGWGVEKIADTWAILMQRLGYQRYFAQGGDWGSIVTAHIGSRDPEHCAGIHLNMVVSAPTPSDPPTPRELEALAALQHYDQWDSGYSKQQSTRPQTLGYALADSPSGQATWIVEKFWSWSDCGDGADKHPENVLSRDEILDNIMVYWLNNTAASSARLYWESFNAPGSDIVNVPMGGSIFPTEIFRSPRHWAEKRYTNIVYWNELEQGGHFAAFEQPDLFISEVRSAFKQMTL